MSPFLIGGDAAAVMNDSDYSVHRGAVLKGKLPHAWFEVVQPFV